MPRCGDVMVCKKDTTLGQADELNGQIQVLGQGDLVLLGRNWLGRWGDENGSAQQSNEKDHSEFLLGLDYVDEEILAIDAASGEAMLKEVDQTLEWKEVVINGKAQLVYVLPEAPPLPKPDPKGRDTHLPSQIKDATMYWVSYLVQKREAMKMTKYLFFSGPEEMVNILKHVFGATDEDIEELRHVCDNMNQDPHLKFRKTSMYRLGLDLNLGTARRLRREPFVLTEADGFKRHDSGLHRFFGEPQAWVFENSAFRALMQFKAFIMYGIDTLPRRGCDPARNWNMCGFFLRTITTPNLLGEPAAEGVHQDGVEFTMTTMFKSGNMRADAAKSCLYNLKQEIGVQRHEADPQNIIDTVQHRNYLDTLIFVDNQLSHSVSPVHLDDPKRGAHRDMAVLFTRRMAKAGGGFSAEPFDSELGHDKLPFAMGLKSRHLAEHYPIEAINSVA